MSMILLLEAILINFMSMFLDSSYSFSFLVQKSLQNKTIKRS